MSRRAERRHHKDRVRSRALRLFAGPLSGRNPDYAHVVADNITVCSCWMCGNPRRHYRELTIQERRADEKQR